MSRGAFGRPETVAEICDRFDREQATAARNVARGWSAKAVRVINKHDVCTCGCHGSDPWHRSVYRRIVKAIETRADGRTIGVVRLPFSTLPVQVVRVAASAGGLWEVVEASIVRDR